MAILGAHMSIAGGFENAVIEAHRCGCDCVQLFTKNNNQWAAKPIGVQEAERFAAAKREARLGPAIAHTSYLINLASPVPALWKKSLEAFVVELRRAEQLGLSHLVVHPGAFTSGSELAGLKQVIKAVNETHAQTRGFSCRCLLETTAGQGSCLGWRFEQLATILDGVRDPERLGVCFDTCHVFAAGYPLAPEADYKATMREWNRLIGTRRIEAFHVNDSLKALGSRVDRHEHIGRGQLGLEPFRLLLNDRRFRRIPMILETAKGLHRRTPWDVVNLRVLRGLIAS